MNSMDAARIMARLHGAFPHVAVDDAVTAVWANVLDTTDYAYGVIAATIWIDNNNFWPTIAQFNALVTEVRRERANLGGPREIMQAAALRCDGTGWLDRGQGLEPCPTCSPWNRERWMSGDWDRRMRPPVGYVMPEPCSGHHPADGPIVTSRQRAMQLALGGLREQLAENGLMPEEIDETVERRMPTVLAAVANVPDA